MRKKASVIISILGLVGALFFSAKVFAVEHNVSGYAWSENIGWISFNCAEDFRNVCSTSSYGVDISSNGDFSGYAWSAHVGWISFNAAQVASCGPAAKLDMDSGAVSGWAKILNPGEGKSGCIKMASEGYNYGVVVNLNIGYFFNFAWSEDFGWISFRGNNYGVETSLVGRPKIISATAEFPSPCAQSRIPRISWMTDADKPYNYKISFCDDPSCDEASVLFTRTEMNTHSVSWTPSCTLLCEDDDYSKIAFGGHTYYVKIQASNISGDWGMPEIISFTSHENAYPYPDFTCNEGACDKLGVYEEQELTLASDSDWYDGTEAASCYWTLPEGVTQIIEGDVNSCVVKVIFTASGEQSITLEVTDSNNYSCSETKNMNVMYPLPEYKETSPISLLKGVLVNLFTKVVSVFASF